MNTPTAEEHNEVKLLLAICGIIAGSETRKMLEKASKIQDKYKVGPVASCLRMSDKFLTCKEQNDNLRFALDFISNLPADATADTMRGAAKSALLRYKEALAPYIATIKNVVTAIYDNPGIDSSTLVFNFPDAPAILQLLEKHNVVTYNIPDKETNRRQWYSHTREVSDSIIESLL